MTTPPPVRHPPCTTPGCTCDHNPNHYPTGCDRGFEPVGRRVRICRRCKAYRLRRIAEKAEATKTRKTTPKETSDEA